MILIIRALEKTDLSFIHHPNDEYSIMSYWLEEPYQSLSELRSLCVKHILDEAGRRSIVEERSTPIGVVELLEINSIHRTCEMLIIIDSQHVDNGYAKKAFKMAIDHVSLVLSMNKAHLYVDIKSERAVHIYQSNNFEIEGTLKKHSYMRGEYGDCYVADLLKRNRVNKNDDDLSHIRWKIRFRESY